MPEQLVYLPAPPRPSQHTLINLTVPPFSTSSPNPHPSLSSPPLLRLYPRRSWPGHPTPSHCALPALTPSWPRCRTRCTSASLRHWGAASPPTSSRGRNARPLPPPATPPSLHRQTPPRAHARPVAGNCRPSPPVPPTPSSPRSYVSLAPSFSRWWTPITVLLKPTNIHSVSSTHVAVHLLYFSFLSSLLLLVVAVVFVPLAWLVVQLSPRAI